MNGEKHWFVNGRDTGQVALATVSSGAVHNMEPMWTNIDEFDDTLVVLVPRRADSYSYPKHIEDPDTHIMGINWDYWKPTRWWMCRQEDINPHSATYGMIIKTTQSVPDEFVDQFVVRPNWVEFSRQYVGTVVNQPYAGTSYTMRTGYITIKERDEEPLSATYLEERTREEFDQSIANTVFDNGAWVPVNQTPNWSPVYHYPSAEYDVALANGTIIELVDANGLKTGYAEWRQSDINPWSPTLQKTRAARLKVGDAEQPRYTVKATLNNTNYGIVTMKVNNGTPQNVNILTVEKGSTVTITVTPLEGYRFVKFCKEGGSNNIATQSGNGWVYTFNVTGNASFIGTLAVVETPRYNLTTSFDHCDLYINGAKQNAPGWAEYEVGTHLAFEAVPEDSENYVFKGWYAGPTAPSILVGSELTYECDLNSNLYIAPVFEPVVTEVYELIIKDDGSGNLVTLLRNKTTGEVIDPTSVGDKECNIITVDTRTIEGGEFKLTYQTYVPGSFELPDEQKPIVTDGEYWDWSMDPVTRKVYVSSIIKVTDNMTIYVINNFNVRKGLEKAREKGVIDEVITEGDWVSPTIH